MLPRRILCSLVVCATALLTATVYSTPAHTQTTQVTVDAHPLAFEVVSIRENHSSSRPMHLPDLGPTPDGYRATNSPLLFPLITAYPPTAPGNSFYSPAQITGLPDWAMQQPYDLTAKVSEAELPEWQKPASQSGMLRAMLQSFFIERCKIAVHRESKEGSVLFLVVARNGPRLKPTDPAETHTGISIPGGGLMMPGPQGMMAYGISTSALATMMSMMGGGQMILVDRTGLTGRYDIVLKMRERAGPDMDVQTMVQQQLDELGLKLESGKAPIERLVIDHIERPSAN